MVTSYAAVQLLRLQGAIRRQMI